MFCSPRSRSERGIDEIPWTNWRSVLQLLIRISESALQSVSYYTSLHVAFNYVTPVRDLQNCVHCSGTPFLS